MTDEFGDKAGKLARIGAAQIPILGLAVELVSVFLPPNADERLHEAVRSDIFETMLRLQARVEELAKELAGQGMKLDELRATHAVALAREVAKAQAEARSESKTNALVNAAARQLDPRLGDQAIREFWFNQVRNLSDVAIRLLTLLGEHSQLGIGERSLFTVRKSSKSLLQVPPEEVAALRAAVIDMRDRFRNTPVLRSGEAWRASDGEEISVIALESFGEALVKFIR